MQLRAVIEGDRQIIRRLNALVEGMNPRKARRAFQKAARYYVRSSRKYLTANVRANRRNYPPWSTRRRRGTRSLWRSIRVQRRPTFLQVTATGKRGSGTKGYHARLVETGHAGRGRRVRGYPFFFRVLRAKSGSLQRMIVDGMDMIVAAAVRRR